MQVLAANSIAHHWRDDGDADGQPVVFANSLGTDLRLWDAVLPLLPTGFRFIRYDKRGHGLSECPPGPYSIDDLTADVEGLIDALDLGPVIFVGLSVGGMIGQSLAHKRPDLVKALVLSNTAAKMGTVAIWQDRIAMIRRAGIEPAADAILDRWFDVSFRKSSEALLWRAMLTRMPSAGYLGYCAAIAAADLTDATQTLRLPVLCIAGSEDGACPATQVAETCALIPGAVCHTIPGTGHLPCAEAPNAYAAILTHFLKEQANA